MKTISLWIIPAVLIGVLALAYLRPWEPDAPRIPEAQTTPADPSAEPQVRYPVETAQAEASLPSLSESDGDLRNALHGFFGEKLPKLLLVDRIVHRVVATVDNLPRDYLSSRLLPVRTAPGLPVTEKTEERFVLSERNRDRYRPYIEMADAIPTAALVKLYARFYPLFQEQYEKLGYPGKYFNDRAVDVIDHLLATPETPEPLRLIQPRVLYEFADPELESLSAGQKILLRVGKPHRDRMKEKLRELRAAITALGRAG